jgi:hypothetical protein
VLNKQLQPHSQTVVANVSGHLHLSAMKAVEADASAAASPYLRLALPSGAASVQRSLAATLSVSEHADRVQQATLLTEAVRLSIYHDAENGMMNFAYAAPLVVALAGTQIRTTVWYLALDGVSGSSAEDWALVVVSCIVLIHCTLRSGRLGALML